MREPLNLVREGENLIDEVWNLAHEVKTLVDEVFNVSSQCFHVVHEVLTLVDEPGRLVDQAETLVDYVENLVHEVWRLAREVLNLAGAFWRGESGRSMGPIGLIGRIRLMKHPAGACHFAAATRKDKVPRSFAVYGSTMSRRLYPLSAAGLAAPVSSLTRNPSLPINCSISGVASDEMQHLRCSSGPVSS